MKLPTKLRLTITVLSGDDEAFLGPDGEPDFDIAKYFSRAAIKTEDAARKLSKALRAATDELREMADHGAPVATELRRDRNSRLN